MVEFVLIAATLLAGQAAPVSQLKPKEAAKPKVAAAMDPAKALAHYNEMREKTPPTATAQWKLGLWCEEHGLKAEAYVHFAEVVRRDPRARRGLAQAGLQEGRRPMDDRRAARRGQRAEEGRQDLGGSAQENPQGHPRRQRGQEAG